MPGGIFMIQYVDDLLLAATSRSAYLSAFINLLTFLGNIGFQIKQSKLHFFGKFDLTWNSQRTDGLFGSY